MNIAFYTKTLLAEESMEPPGAFPQLAETAEDMLRKSLDAFTQKSCDMARSVIGIDEEADELHDRVFRELMSRVCADSAAISRGLELVLIARALERIADHAVSIAEDVVYVVEGRNIRHVHDPNNGS
jgi:phosphate transport system protein